MKVNELRVGNWFYRPCCNDQVMEIRGSGVLWFVAGLCDTLDWSLEQIAQDNLAKLKSRQERGVIIGNGDER